MLRPNAPPGPPGPRGPLPSRVGGCSTALASAVFSSAGFASAVLASADFSSTGFGTRTAVRAKTRSPHTTGVEDAEPGTATFHFTFLVSLHSSGGSASGATPLASGPRHCGQLRRASAESLTAEVLRAKAAAKSPAARGMVFMANQLLVYGETELRGAGPSPTP